MKYLHRLRRTIIVVLVSTTVHYEALCQLPTVSPDTVPSLPAIPHTARHEPKRITYRSFILPASLITVGAVSASGNFLIPDQAIYDARNRNLPRFHTSLDNYLEFAGFAAGYGMLLHDPQHNVWNYTQKVLATELMVVGLTQTVKRTVRRPRPFSGERESFPSGHTAQAFAGATLFADEFAQHNTWLTVASYTTATAVGVLRILNNRHWASDVVAGAGFGILSAKLSELIVEPRGKKHEATYTIQL